MSFFIRDSTVVSVTAMNSRVSDAIQDVVIVAFVLRRTDHVVCGLCIFMQDSCLLDFLGCMHISYCY